METKYITVSIANTNSHSKKLRTCAMIAAFLLMLAATLLFPASAQSEQAGNRPLSEQKPAVAPEPKDALTDIEQRPVEILQLPDDSEQDPAPVAVILFDVPEADTGFKAYMDFRSIKDRTTAQYRLQQEAWTDEQGFRRLGDRYMIALGTFYSKQCGSVFRITLESGASFEAVVADIKADADTDTLHQHHDGNVVEFIVDVSEISQDCRVMGDMSWADENFWGKIAIIECVGKID